MPQTGVSQKAFIFNDQGHFLTIRRTETAPARPNTWDAPGGDLDFGEEVIQGIKREIKEETGLDISNFIPFDVESHVNKQGDFWITIAYKAKTDSDKITLSFEHNEYKWLTPKEFLNLESSPVLKKFAEKLL